MIYAWSAIGLGLLFYGIFLVWTELIGKGISSKHNGLKVFIFIFLGVFILGMIDLETRNVKNSEKVQDVVITEIYEIYSANEIGEYIYPRSSNKHYIFYRKEAGKYILETISIKIPIEIREEAHYAYLEKKITYYKTDKFSFFYMKRLEYSTEEYTIVIPKR